MSKAVLISIKPKWCDLIRRGRKTVEVRKTCPKLEVPFKVYIYETMDSGRGSGLVFGEFVCAGFDVFRPIGKGISIKRFPALYESCLTLDEIVKYAQGEPVYGWQISQLKLYEEPLKLEDFSRHGFCGMNGTGVCGNEIRKLRGMTLSEFSRQSGLSPHTARNLMGYRELYGNPRLDTMVDAARALNAVVTISPKGVTIRARKESA